MTSVTVTELNQAIVVEGVDGTAVVATPSPSVIVQVDEVGPQGPQGETGSSVPRSITIVDPIINDTFTVFRTSVSTTISSVLAIVRGIAPSVTFALKADPDRNAVGTALISSTTVTNTTTGDAAVVINQPVPAGFYVWLEITAVSGTVTELNVGIEV
jgi:hypothetical protein